MYLLALILILTSFDSIFCQIKKPVIDELFASPTLAENKKFSITCQPNDDQVSYEWLFNGQRIQPNENIIINNHEDNSMLNIRKMSLEYAGEYSCKIRNSANQEDKRTISVKLNGR